MVQFSPLHTQELTGKWKGYFIPNNDPESRIYIYEVEIKENENHDLILNEESTFENRLVNRH